MDVVEMEKAENNLSASPSTSHLHLRSGRSRALPYHPCKHEDGSIKKIFWNFHKETALWQLTFLPKIALLVIVLNRCHQNFILEATNVLVDAINF
jgi:hypothetical protein